MPETFNVVMCFDGCPAAVAIADLDSRAEAEIRAAGLALAWEEGDPEAPTFVVQPALERLPV